MELDDAYAQTFDRLRRMFRARGCSAEESADLAQEAAIRAFTHIRRWGVNGVGLDPLLNRIARNLLIDRYRRVSPHVVSLDAADEIQDPTQDPSEEVARRQRRRAVQSAIRALPTRHRKAISFSLSGLSPAEVGKEMGIGRNAADALLHRARRSLREHLAPVRDGMWGVALLVRIRWDRLTRRAGVEGRVADASLVAVTNSMMSVATAAVVAVLTVTGGTGGGTAAYARPSPRPAGSVTHAVSGRPGAPASASSGAGGAAASSGGNARAYSVGLLTGSHGGDGSDNHVTVATSDDDNHKILDVHYWVVKQTRDAEPAGPTVADRACTALAKVCGGDGA